MIDIKSYLVKAKLENTNRFGKNNQGLETEDSVYLLSCDEIKKYNVEFLSELTDYNLLMGAEADIDGKFNLLRTCTEEGYLCVKRDDENDIGSARPYDTTTVLSPVLNLKFSIFKDLNIKVNNELTQKNKEIATFILGEYPQNVSMISDQIEELYYENQLNNTGNQIFNIQYRIIKSKDYVYEYAGEKYVRITPSTDEAIDDFDTPLSNNESIDVNKAYWLKVEPIKWQILNWKNMPKEINPNGDGTAKSIIACSMKSLVSGIAFCDYKDRGSFCCAYWQNSAVRAYLNGYNIQKELENGNGNKKVNLDTNYNFTEKNFLTDAFSNLELTKENEVIEEIRKRKQNKFGIQVLDKPLSISDQIKFYIETGKSFMLHGPSGIGKTRRIEEIDPDFVSIVLRNGMLPEEVIGKQIYPNNDKTTTGIWTPPSWYTKLCELCEREPQKNHVLFIDEITNVKPTEQSLVYNLVLTHSIGPNIGKLPKNVVVVAAGNSKEESESAYNMPEPLFRRFEAHIELPLDIKDWLIWGSEPSKENPEQTKIHPLVSAFVAAKGNKVFYTGYDSENPPKFAIDPRGWEQISDIIYSNKGAIVKELIENKVGKDIATDFIAFAQNPPLTLEDILENNYSSLDIPKNYDGKYALVISLRNATEEQVKTVREFISNNLGNELLSVFDTNWVGENNERAILIANQTLKKVDLEYKIKIDEFFNTNEEIGIVLSNANEYNTLVSIFNQMGKTWRSGEQYKLDNDSNFYKKILFNDGTSLCYSSKDLYESNVVGEKAKLFNFNEVDFSHYIKEPKKIFKYTFDEFSNVYDGALKALKITDKWQSKVLTDICKKTNTRFEDTRKDENVKQLYQILKENKNFDNYYITSDFDFWNLYNGKNIESHLKKCGYEVLKFDDIDFSKYYSKGEIDELKQKDEEKINI